MSNIKAGAARRDITPQPGIELCGQLHRRICDGIRDPLEVNAAYLDNGSNALLILSVDHVGLYANEWEAGLRSAIIEATGLPSAAINITCTHTHTAPDIFGLLHDSDVAEAYARELHDAIVACSREAVETARPARVGWGSGHAHIGYNRRLCWSDATHSMYGNSQRPDYTGLEGPDDPTHTVLFAVNEDDTPLFIVHNNNCHTTCVEGATQVSADFPGEARRLLRETWHDELPVLYLQGASGDTSPWPMENGGSRYREARLHEIGAALAGETSRLIRLATPIDCLPIATDRQQIQVAIRLATPEQLARAKQTREAGEEAAGRRDYVLDVCGVIRLHETFADNPTDTLTIQSARVGGFAMTTNPCELYCQFGLDIRRRSPADATAIVQLANGFNGYCPTLYGILGGGYSGSPTYWTRLEAAAGYRIVDEASRQLHGLWRDA